MVKKGKFNLLSLIIEDQLIFYKSLNKHHKYIAFAILKVVNLPKILPLLNSFLKKRYLNYYSVQINVRHRIRKLIILNFMAYEKEKIIQFFNLISKDLIENENTVTFCKKNGLKNEFFKILTYNFNLNIELQKKENAIAIKNQEKLNIIYIYYIDFDKVQKFESFLHNFIKFINDMDQYGYLVFNINMNHLEELDFNSYYICKCKKKQMNKENQINSLFNANIISNVNINLNSIYRILWRANISEKNNKISNIFEIFQSFSYYDFQNLSRFNTQIENTLKLKNISYHRLNNNLLLIEQKFLFLVLESLNINIIKNIIKRHLTNHMIYILVISKQNYEKLMETKEITLIENLKIMNNEDFVKFDFSIFQ